MHKLVDFQCPKCGAKVEGDVISPWNGDDYSHKDRIVRICPSCGTGFETQSIFVNINPYLLVEMN